MRSSDVALVIGASVHIAKRVQNSELRRLVATTTMLAMAAWFCACGTSTAKPSADAAAADVATDTAAPANGCPKVGAKGAGIDHVVVIVQENHTFDSYFGRWCTAAPGSNPTCIVGGACCEAAPLTEPSGATPTVLDDAANAAYDPNHHAACEVAEFNGGKMDRFVQGAACSDPRNFAISPKSTVQPYWDMAEQGALADRYFQPIAGQSTSNDMYLAVAKEVFLDNAFDPPVTGSHCSLSPTKPAYDGQTTIADLLKKAGKTVTWYGEGLDVMAAAGAQCPDAPAACPMALPLYPCLYDPGDVPFLYYTQFADGFVRDFDNLAKDLSAGNLPDVAFVKGLGFRTEHPGQGTTLTDGIHFVQAILQAIDQSCYKDNTLILLTWDEGGGYFDHVAPPADSAVDKQPYGTRVPLLALGHYARKGIVSHVVMEHSSIVKFLEWNYLGHKTGQLGARDAVVNNLGSLLDPALSGITVPEQAGD